MLLALFQKNGGINAIQGATTGAAHFQHIGFSNPFTQYIPQGFVYAAVDGDENTICDSDISSDRVPEFNIQLIDIKDVRSFSSPTQHTRFR